MHLLVDNKLITLQNETQVTQIKQVYGTPSGWISPENNAGMNAKGQHIHARVLSVISVAAHLISPFHSFKQHENEIPH